MSTVILDIHERSLIEILHGEDEPYEKAITVTLTEHLLKIIAPGQSYVTHNKVESCACTDCKSSGLQANPVFGRTGIGMNYFKNNFIG